MSTVLNGRLSVPFLPLRMRMGPRCNLGEYLYLSTSRTAEIILGDSVLVNRGCTIVASQSIRIGSGAQIGEFVSIRDQQHKFVVGHGVIGQGFKVSPIQIGENVWIGRGSFIGPGTNIGNDTIIAANSVVHGIFPAGVLLAGAPAKIKRVL